jgi:hypothetical protein
MPNLRVYHDSNSQSALEKLTEQVRQQCHLSNSANMSKGVAISASFASMGSV